MRQVGEWVSEEEADGGGRAHFQRESRNPEWNPWELQRGGLGRDGSQTGLVWGSPRMESQEREKELARRDPAKGRKKLRRLGPSHFPEDGAQQMSCG